MSEITFTGTDISVPITYVGLYSDTTPMVKTDEWEDILKADTLVLRPKSLSTFVTAMFLVDAVLISGGKVKNLILPYVPGARQDRVNPTGDVLYTAGSVGAMINQRGFERVVILDPHSPVVTMNINNVVVFPQELVAAKVWQGYTGIIAADKGGKDRAEQFAHAMNLPIYYGAKHRNPATGKLSGFGLEKIPFGHYLVVDDICDGGGTFIGLAELIKDQGSFADLFVTHGIFSKGSSDLRKVYKNIYTTDSRDIHDTHVHIIPVVQEMENF